MCSCMKESVSLVCMLCRCVCSHYIIMFVCDSSTSVISFPSIHKRRHFPHSPSSSVTAKILHTISWHLLRRKSTSFAESWHRCDRVLLRWGRGGRNMTWEVKGTTDQEEHDTRGCKPITWGSSLISFKRKNTHRYDSYYMCGEAYLSNLQTRKKNLYMSRNT